MKKILCFSFVLNAIFLSASSPSHAASGVTADVSTVQFGSQAAGIPSEPQTITLTNSEGGDGVVWTITLAGESPLQFLISEDSCSATVLAPGDSCTVSVIYLPSAGLPGSSPAQALLQVPFNDPPALSIALSGNEVTPQIESDVASFDFGSQVAGQLSDAHDFTLTNSGAADLILENTKIIGANSADFAFSTDQCSFQVLGPGESCAFELAMRPTALGQRMAQVAIESNDPETPVLTIDLQGNGTGSGGCALGKTPIPVFFDFISAFGLFLPVFFSRRVRAFFTPAD